MNSQIIIAMANLSDLNVVISDLFGVLSTLIAGVVDLITGDLLVLTIVGAFIALIVGVIYAVLAMVKKQVNSGMKK